MYKNPVVTEVLELKEFYRAEDYHLDYYDNNQKEGYCRAVITPKVEKIVKHFNDQIKNAFKWYNINHYYADVNLTITAEWAGTWAVKLFVAAPRLT